MWKNGAKYEGGFQLTTQIHFLLLTAQLTNNREGYGIQFFPDGKTQYEGYWKEDLPNGYGIENFPENSVYQLYKGMYKDHVFSGNGTMTFKDGAVYEGEFKDNKRHGFGILYKKNLLVYEGNWENNKFNGFGKFNFLPDDVHERLLSVGYFKDGLLSGNGTLIWLNELKYEGEFKADNRHGFGILQRKNELVYEGYWDNNNYDGFGKVYFPPDDVRKRLSFEGYFKDGVASGNGTVIWVDGNKYEGEFKANIRHGFGIQNQTNGVFYEGYWINDTPSGVGKFKFPFADSQKRLSLDGHFKDGVASGNGTLIWLDGQKYEGEFKVDKRDGFGIETFPGGGIKKGYWVNNEFNGFGSLTFKEEDAKLSYEGGFKDDDFSGNGTLVYKNGETYLGEFKNGALNGFGKFTYSIDDDEERLEFEGFFQNNEIQGNKTLLWKSGEKYEGHFDNGQLSGIGIKYGSDGVIVGKGEWERGILISPD